LKSSSAEPRSNRTTENSKQPLLSVIIVNFQGSRFIRGCLRSVLSSDYSSFEVLVVDNASTDGSVELVEEEFENDPRVTIVRNKVNVGFAKANNQAAKISHGELLLFLNADTRMDESSMRRLAEAFRSDERIAVAQPKLLLIDTDPPRIDSTGDLMDPYGNGYRRGVGLVDRGQFDDKVDEIFSARGAAMIVKRDIFTRVGMFDEDFFLYLEDVDLCWRIRLADKSIRYVPKAVVFHAGAGSRDQDMLAQAWFHVIKNQLAMIVKNYSWRHLPKSLAGRLLCYAIVAIYYPVILAKTHGRRENAGFLTRPARTPQMARAVLGGMFWNLRSLRQTLSKRSRIQTFIRRTSDEAVSSYMEKRDPMANLLRQIDPTGLT
jgi:GT2 family glycosyltransferase